MSQIAIEIGSYSIKAVARDTEGRNVVSHTLEMPSWCACEESKGTANYYIGHNARLWRFQSLAFPVYFKENADEYFRNVVQSIVQYVKLWAEELFPKSPIQDLHFITPMYYRSNDPLVEDMQIAATKAGINKVYFVPSHVALCKRQAYVHEGESVLVYDLGYRNFTLSLLRRNRSDFEVIQSVCLKDCAGMKIESVLINDMMKTQPEDLPSMLLFEDAARQIKEGLSVYKTYRCALPGMDDIYELDRTRFNDMVSPIVSGTFQAVKNLLAKADETPAEMLFCGGSSRMSYVKDRLSYLAKEIAPDSLIKDCTIMENMNHMVCEGCFLAKNDIDISF